MTCRAWRMVNLNGLLRPIAISYGLEQIVRNCVECYHESITFNSVFHLAMKWRGSSFVRKEPATHSAWQPGLDSI
jgi:hypothetical protein